MMDKYQKAIKEYFDAQKELRSLTNKIGGALERCSTSSSEDYLRADGKSRHLHDAFDLTGGDDEWGGNSLVYVNGNPETYLKETCPYCYAAYKLIQVRKGARQRFGNAKRKITVLGKSL